jgi:hypothetical protein
MRITQALSAPTGPVDQRRLLLGYAIRIASLIVPSQFIACAGARHVVTAGSGVIVFLQRRP